MTETILPTDDKDTDESGPPSRPMSHPLTGRLLGEWHAALDSSGSDQQEKMYLANRGDRALLRRSRTIDEVLQTPVYYELRYRLAKLGIDVTTDWDGDRRLAAVIGILAWVKTNDESKPFSQQLASRRKESSDAKLSGLRFRKLLQIDDRDDLYRAMIGVIRLIDGKANVFALAKDIYYWRPDTSCDVRKRWAEHYYTAAPEET